MNRGFVLMEVLIAMLILEVALLGLAELFSQSIAFSIDLERSTFALELLRGEMEKCESMSFNFIRPQFILLAPGIHFSRQVIDIDENHDNIIDYKRILGKVFWGNYNGGYREFLLVTYRERT